MTVVGKLGMTARHHTQSSPTPIGYSGERSEWRWF